MEVDTNGSKALREIVLLISEKTQISGLSRENYISTENMRPNRMGIEPASALPSGKANKFIVRDVLFSNIRTYFRKVWLSSFEGGASPDVLIFRPRNHDVLDSRYLFYLLSDEDFIYYTDKTSNGAKMPRGDKDAILKYQVKLPPLPTQRAIAHILGTLDDLIELNRETNELLEEMARALFKSWFVDFDPVRAKLEGRPPAGMDAATAALFPDHFQDSELGQIPRGWEVKPLAYLTSYLSRGIGPAYVEEGGVCVLNQKCVRDHRVDLARARRHCALKKKVDGRFLERFDVLVNSTGTGTLGRVAQIFQIEEAMIVDSHITVVRAASDVDPRFLGAALVNREADIEELAEGSTGQTELSRTRLGALAIVTPNAEIQRAFGKLIEPTFNLMSENDRESRDLATLRDTLLPKLLSGEITVPVAEELVAAAS